MTACMTASTTATFHEVVVEVFGTICDLYDVCPDDVPFDEPEIGRARAAVGAIEGGSRAMLLSQDELTLVAGALRQHPVMRYEFPPNDLCDAPECVRCGQRRLVVGLFNKVSTARAQAVTA